MRKIIIPIILLSASGILYAQNTTSENYVQSTTYIDYPAAGSPKTAVSVQYLDGLARPKQTVNVKASPLGNDVVSHVEYDAFGRQAKEYLPVPQNGTLNGAIVQNPLANASNTPYGSEKIYAAKTLESSPLDRSLEQRQVGNAWNDKPVIMGYGSNAAGEVKKYAVVTSWGNGVASSSVSSPTTYAAGLLYSISVTDEDGNKTTEFKNSRGQVILVRKAVNATQNADTYYVYNEYDQLVLVIPPLADAAPNLSSVLDALCYQYKYDDRSRMAAKKLPGKGWEYMVYDKQDRMVMTQDAEMGKTNQWMFTKYDQFGRAVYTGIYTSTAAYGLDGRQTEQNNVNTNGSNNEARGSSSPDSTVSGLNYSNTAYPVSSIKIFTINYYDSFPRDSWFPADLPGVILNQKVILNSQSGYAKGLLLASYVKNIEDDSWTRSFMLYDPKGRLIGSRSTNHLGGSTNIDMKLNFAGLTEQSITRHRRLSTDTERIITETFEYDNQNRPLAHKHKVDSNPEEYLSQNEYNELSQLKTKKVGGTTAGQPLQNINYQYNIRGWMTQINDPADLAGGKLFGYTVKYTNPETPNITGRYNGNIAEIDWKTATVANDNIRRYDYTYDSLNRLMEGAYSEPYATVKNNDYFTERLSYDLNGNITALQRFAMPSSGITANKIDDLIYNYENGGFSNKLAQVTLPSGVVNNASGYNALGNTFVYDLNGNMTSHLDKGINEINYNFLNLPSEIKERPGTKTGITTQYVYRADGVKIGKSYRKTSTSQTTITLYLDGFQYSISDSQVAGSELQFVATSEGYFNFQKNQYIYNYTDHLGNVRVSYFINGRKIEVLEESNYYPFGLKHEGYNVLTGNSAYKYKYNGKELQETGMYDYGARFYMPDLGRWGVVDPLAEKMTRHSPYNYAFNNPIRFIDPDGRAPETDFTLNIKTGEVKQVGETNNEPDRILKTDNKENVKYDRNGEAKIAVDNIEKGILKDGQNLKENDNIIDTGGKNQPSLAGVEDFLVKVSDYVGVEFSGAYLSSENSKDAKITGVYIDEYKGNSNSSSDTSINRKSLVRQGLYTNTSFHTHPTLGYGRSASTSSSQADRDFRDGWKGFKLIHNFIILTRPETGPGVEKIDYTND